MWSTSAPPRATSGARRSCRELRSSRCPRAMDRNRRRHAALAEARRMMPEPPSLDDFLAQAEAVLQSRYPRRAFEEGSRFHWGEGSDEVRVFQEPDPVEEAEALPRIRAWRAALWDAGLAWISGPKEYGGGGGSAKRRGGLIQPRPPGHAPRRWAPPARQRPDSPPRPPPPAA